jgi:opacity protein-like surface antigen
MKKIVLAFIATALTLLAATAAMATPSTQIWIPSTDVQGYKTLHIGIDNYTRTRDIKDAAGNATEVRNNIYDLGLTAGVLPFEKLQMEVGVDYLTTGDAFDDYPIQFNAKLGTPEDALFKNSPALAIGGYGFGTNSKKTSNARTDFNIGYALAAKTLPVVGRFSGGYYVGNSAVLNDETGANDNKGVLLSWDRTLSEISDKLWLGVDYMGGDNAFGALNFGVSYAFTKNISLIVGYDVFNKKATAGQNTFNTQLDINFP